MKGLVDKKSDAPVELPNVVINLVKLGADGRLLSLYLFCSFFFEPVHHRRRKDNLILEYDLRNIVVAPELFDHHFLDVVTRKVDIIEIVIFILKLEFIIAIRH